MGGGKWEDALGIVETYQAWGRNKCQLPLGKIAMFSRLSGWGVGGEVGGGLVCKGGDNGGGGLPGRGDSGRCYLRICLLADA